MKDSLGLWPVPDPAVVLAVAAGSGPLARTLREVVSAKVLGERRGASEPRTRLCFAAITPSQTALAFFDVRA
jgi:hypothetical protein